MQENIHPSTDWDTRSFVHYSIATYLLWYSFLSWGTFTSFELEFILNLRFCIYIVRSYQDIYTQL